MINPKVFHRRVKCRIIVLLNDTTMDSLEVLKKKLAQAQVDFAIADKKFDDNPCQTTAVALSNARVAIENIKFMISQTPEAIKLQNEEYLASYRKIMTIGYHAIAIDWCINNGRSEEDIKKSIRIVDSVIEKEAKEFAVELGLRP